tara:strand:+ start:1480 stop:1644 length:165 start_codon:yes stop_codon:yes gene_type:complete
MWKAEYPLSATFIVSLEKTKVINEIINVLIKKFLSFRFKILFVILYFEKKINKI